MPTDVELEGRALSRWESDGGLVDPAGDVAQQMVTTEPQAIKRRRYGQRLCDQAVVNLASNGGWFSLTIAAAIVVGVLIILIF